MPGVADMTRQRGGEPFAGEIFVNGGLSLSRSIARASLCTWAECCDIEREDGESEDAFMSRVRAARFERGAWIVWNPLPEPGW
jgi:hypothetical protein